MDRWSRPCYDKPRRCPGWAGGGWKGPQVTKCVDGTIRDAYEGRWWRWKVHTCPDCGVKVLPYTVQWTDWQTWYWEIRHFRNRMWFFKLERFWHKKIVRDW